jgi:hypothetical protein
MKRGLYDLQYATGGEIRAIYQDLFGRQPDPEGLAYWSEQLKGAPISEAYRQIGGGATGRDVREVSAAEIASKSRRYIPDEYFTEPQAVYGDEPIDSVTEAYQRLFNRTPSVEEVNYYQNLFGDTINPFELERMIAGAQNEDVSAVATPSRISGDLFVGAPIERPATPTPVTATATPAPAMDLTYGGAAPFSAPTSYRTLMGTNVETPTSTGLVSLYRNVLGRLPDAEGYNAYMEAFGPTIDPLEAEQFRAGAMNELAQKAERQSYDRQQFAERVVSPLIGGSAKYTSPVTNAAAARTFTPTADFGYNTQVQPFPITPGLIASPLARGAGAANTGATNTGATNTSTIATVGADGFSGSSAYLPGQNIAGVTFTDTPDAASPEPMPLPYSSTIPFGNEGQTPVLQPILTTTREGQPTADDVDNSRTSGILKTIIGEQAPAEISNRDFPTPMPGVPGDDEGSEDPVDVIGRYAGGPVTGSPQYFEEGGKVEPMQKFGAEDLGSTFDISEYIDPDTGRFMINEYRRDVVFNPELERAETAARASMTPEQKKRDLQALMIRRGQTGREYGLPLIASGFATSGIRPMNQYTYAKGGLADAARYGYAEELRQQGRNGDTILAHINPTEAKMLEAMGGSGTINPRTGLPEYGFSWKKLFKIGSMVMPFFGLPPITTAIASGALAGASTPGKAFDFKRGLQVGLTSYMGAKAGEYLGKEMAARAATDTASKVAGATGPQIGGYGDFTSGQVAGGTQAATSAAPTIAQQITSALPDVSQYIPATVNPVSVGQAVGTVSAQSAADEAIKLREAQQAIIDEEERRRKGYLQVAQETGGIQPLTFGAARGGLIALAGGGAIDPVAFEGGGMTAPINQPRMLSGGGDGMSDSIPATIDGTQPARLADGEFVIPADVVADIGNGSSSAGAKRLYGMMDRVRTARHGTTKQPPEIKTNRLMPA